MTTKTAPAAVISALVFNSREDRAAGRERAAALAAAARLAPFTRAEAESHLFHRFGSHAMADADRRIVAEWMAT